MTTISFSNNAFESPEGDSGAFANSNVVTLTRSGDLSGIQTVQVIISNSTPGSAIAGDSASGLTDYDNTSFPITVTFNPGETSQTIQIPIYGDTTVEANDTIGLELINPSNGAILGENSTATLTIQNDDSRGLLDIIFVQDLSGSFGDDIATVRGLIPSFIANILSFEPDAQFAVASFVDKPIDPFGESGYGDYVYRTDLSLTANVTDIQTTYDNLTILSGNDGNESQLEALMQTGLRTSEIGFRDGSKRLAIIFTDAPYHVAGDGSQAGIYAPNNGDAILDGTPAGTGEDYPSIAQVANALSAAGVGVIPVFAVTADNISAYESLIAELGGVGSVVTLESDSSNITSAVQTALEEVVNINVIAASNLLTTEAGGSVTFTVSLTSQPTADVIIPIDSSDTTEGNVGVTSLTFTPTNFNIAQTVTVTGVDDALADGDVSYTIITGAAISSDSNYNGRNAADVAVINVDNEVVLNQRYEFTYTYDNGDSYSGHGYAAPGTYFTGQILSPYVNETGYSGYYTINAIEDDTTGSVGLVYITSYTDEDTGFGTTTNISSNSYGTGLGSEYGNAYDNDGNSFDSYFNYYYEADLSGVGVVQVRLNLLADDGGNPGELIANNQIGVNKSFFVEILVADLRGNAVGVNGLGLDLAWDGFILESINFDPSLDITSQFPLLQDGTLVYDGFIDDLSGGSLPEFELGQAIGVNQLERFALLHFYTENSSNGTSYFTTTVDSAALADDASYSLDVEENQPIEILASYNQYNFTYYYENGDFYKGYVYAQEGTYTEGQQLRGYSNETGNEGYYEIGSIAATTLDSNFNNRVYVTSYTDADTGFGVTTNIGEDLWTADGIHGYSGLGSESGYAYDINGNSSDPLFSNYYEADIYSIPTLSIQPTDAIKAEGNSGLTYFTFTVSRVGSLFYSSSVDWSVMGSGSHSASPDDFASGSYPQGTLDFAPGQDTATIIVEVNGDITSEMDESFSVTLSNPVDAILDTSSVVSNITSSVSGGYGVTTNYYSLAGGGGRFVMDYEMYGIPDQAEIFINGSLAASTSGFVSGSGTLNLDTFALQSGDMVRVVMTGVDFGTAWDYTVQYNGGVQTLNYIADGLILNDDIPSLAITDNSGDGNDSSIKFTTQFPLRKNYAESDWVRPNFADSTKYFDITNTGTGILQVSDIVSNVAGVTTNFGDDLLINPGESQRIQLSYAPSAAGQDFSASNGLVLFTNDPYNSQYAIALSGKSTFNSDINYDGKVNTGDLGSLNQAAKNYKLGIFDPTTDINGDGMINSLDVSVLLSENKMSVFG